MLTGFYLKYKDVLEVKRFFKSLKDFLKAEKAFLEAKGFF